MAVRHGVTDTDKHFIIDPVTRTIINESGKLVLIQYDHNSERFTFECPRYVDDHDMSLCNRVEIHFINTGLGDYRNTGVYEIRDLKIPDDNSKIVTCSWLISQQATQYVGKLNFVIRFACTDEDGVVEYAWNTGIYSDIAISKSIYNSEDFLEDYIDVLEMWKQDLYAAGLKFTSVEQTTTSTQDGGVNVVTMTMTDGSTRTVEIRNGSKGSKGDTGTSITSIARTSGTGAAGTTDIYTITMSNGSTSTFKVYNGKDARSITSVKRTSGNGSEGTLDTYTITFSDNTTSTFQVYNGADGSNIASIARTSGDGSSGTTDTYTVTLTDGTKSTFQVYNGADGKDAVSISSIKRTSGNGAAGTTDTYTVTLTDGTKSTFQVYNGADGNSIRSIARTSGTGAAGTTDTYTITMSNNTKSTFQVYNGADGNSIRSIARTSGTGAAGTADTYTITFSDTSTFNFRVYNGADGKGSGDMLKSVYDPQNKATDVFAYVDERPGGFCVNMTPTESTDPEVTMYESDATYAQIIEAHAAGKIVYAKVPLDDNYFIIPLVGIGDDQVIFWSHSGTDFLALFIGTETGNIAVMEIINSYGDMKNNFRSLLETELQDAPNITMGKDGNIVIGSATSTNFVELNNTYGITVRSGPISAIAGLDGSGLYFSHNSGKITDLADPTNDNDAANKKYVDDKTTTSAIKTALKNTTITIQNELDEDGEEVYRYFTAKSSDGKITNKLGNESLLMQNDIDGFGAVLGASGLQFATDDPNVKKARVTGLAEPTEDDHATNKAYVDSKSRPVVTTEGTGAAFTATVPGIKSLAKGASFLMIPHTASTSKTATLNVNGLGAKSLKRHTSNVSSTLANGYADSWLSAGTPVEVIYNGTYWIVQGMTQTNPHDLSTAVPVAKGGTGATTAAQALQNLGITYGEEDLEAGVSELATGALYFVYE